MPCPHFAISIAQRSKQQSAVASAAYQSGESLFSEYDQKRKAYTEKKGIMYTEIMLPANAPPEFMDRQTLWNSAEAVEKQWNAQLARKIILALPKELPTTDYPKLLREFCNENFVSKGMCADFAIHDKGDGNPHAHIMLTMRAMDENGKWLPKSRKVYDLDENGEKIRLPSGSWKSHKENTVDWNEQYNAENWRHSWETHTNRFLENAGRPERVDLRSFERQGITDQMPTVHLGSAVWQLEKKGIQTNIGNLNREIKATNNLYQIIRKTVKRLNEWLSELFKKREQLETVRNENLTLPQMLMRYMEQRADERADWSKYGQQKGSIVDLQKIAKTVNFLTENNIATLDDFKKMLFSVKSKADKIKGDVKQKEARMRELTKLFGAFAAIENNTAVHDKYVKIGWKARKEKFYEEHSKELNEYNKALKYIKAQHLDLNCHVDSFKAEYSVLEKECKKLKAELEAVQSELAPLNEVKYILGKVSPIDDEAEQSYEKQSVRERINEEKSAQRSEPSKEQQAKKRAEELS